MAWRDDSMASMIRGFVVIGYKVTATNYKQNYVRVYNGWSEGDPKLESKAKEVAAKQILKQILTQGAKLVIGGAAGAVVKVADVVSKPLQGLGTAAGELIAENLMKINRARAEQGLMVSDIVVTLSGDFEGTYCLKNPQDLAALPNLLALIPAAGTTDQFMGESVHETTFMAHLNFARHIYNSGKWDVSTQLIYELEIKIEL